MRILRYLILFALLMLIFIPSVLVLLTFEKTPLVTKTETVDTEKTVHARNLAKRFATQYLREGRRDRPVFITASEYDLNSLMSLAARAAKRFDGRIIVTQQGLSTEVTFRLPHNPIGDFINLQAGIEPAESGLHLSHVSVGRIKIPGRTALFITRVMMDTVLGNDNGTVFLNSIKSVTFHNDTVLFNLRHIPDYSTRKDKIVQRFKALRDSLPTVGDPDAVHVYYANIAEIGSSIPPRQPVSLAYFIGPAFKLAQQRSDNNNHPVEENKAAILALATYAGDKRFEKLIGFVRTGEPSLYRTRTPKILLGGREDLRLHFIISAGLKIVSDSGITSAIGEFKELNDARRGGSGFSFIDLAADMAGTRLAEIATGNDESARKIQSVLADMNSEDTFFPAISDLTENIPQADFERLYGNVENDKYLRIVESIKDRISKLPAYSSFTR